MNTQDECNKLGIDAKIFMLVHDSIVALVKDEDVDMYKAVVQTNTQADFGVTIEGFPIGVDQEVGDDYSFGKFAKQYEIRDDKLACVPAEKRAA